MSRKTLANWQAFNDEFEASKLLVTDFCPTRDFNAKYFQFILS